MSAMKAAGSGDNSGSSKTGGSDVPGRKHHKKVAECCLELLHIEIIALYTRMQQQQQQQPAQARNELMTRRMEAIGFQVGQQLVERYTLERGRFTDHLDVIKFICKDFWAEVFRKQVDNLKTNHRGVYVLQDNKFRWLLRISADNTLPAAAASPPLASTPGASVPLTPATPATPAVPNQAQTASAAISRSKTGVSGSAPSVATAPVGGVVGSSAAALAAASQYLLLPCGIIKGALTNLGVPCTVTAEVTTLPACSFTVRIKDSR